MAISISHHNRNLTNQKRELKRLGSQTAKKLQEFAPLLCKTMLTMLRKSSSGEGNASKAACISPWLLTSPVGHFSPHLTAKTPPKAKSSLWTSQSSRRLDTWDEMQGCPGIHNTANTQMQSQESDPIQAPDSLHPPSPLPTHHCSSWQPQTLLCLLCSLIRPRKGAAFPNKLSLGSIANWSLDIAMKDFGTSDA